MGRGRGRDKPKDEPQRGVGNFGGRAIPAKKAADDRSSGSGKRTWAQAATEEESSESSEQWTRSNPSVSRTLVKALRYEPFVYQRVTVAELSSHTGVPIEVVLTTVKKSQRGDNKKRFLVFAAQDIADWEVQAKKPCWEVQQKRAQEEMEEQEQEISSSTRSWRKERATRSRGDGEEAEEQEPQPAVPAAEPKPSLVQRLLAMGSSSSSSSSSSCKEDVQAAASDAKRQMDLEREGDMIQRALEGRRALEERKRSAAAAAAERSRRQHALDQEQVGRRRSIRVVNC